MRIGFDISVLSVAQAGVLRFTELLLENLLAAGPEHHFTLVDDISTHAGPAPGLDLGRYRQPNATIVTCGGLRRRRLANVRSARGYGAQLARAADRGLDPIWRAAGRLWPGRSLAAAVEPVDLFHSSDVVQYRPRHGAAVVTVHDLTPLLFPELHVGANVALHEAKMRFVGREADAILADSECTRRDVIRQLHVPPERVTVVYGAAAPEFRPVADRAAVLAVAQRYRLAGLGYVLHVGTLEPRKNLVTLIDAYAELVRGPGSSGLWPPLVLAGRPGWRYEEIYRRAETLGLSEQVRFTGPVAGRDLPALMSGAALFVYPSLYEGFGLPPLEAMACGVPVIASSAASLPEVVGDAGVLVDPRAPAALAAAMAALLADPERRAALAAAGLARAAGFSWPRAAAETLAAYARACGATPANGAA